MSHRKNQHSRTSLAHDPTTPFATSNKQPRYKGARSAEPSRRSTVGVRPGSARAILRRLAKITAPTTKRRVVTPTGVSHDKENFPPQLQDDDDDEDIKVPKFLLNLENSMDEEESEILVAPTPSVLFQHSDAEDDHEPTLTFLREKAHLGLDAGGRLQSPGSLHPQSDSAIHDEHVESGDDNENSTFLTERGRRAISEEPTRMSRYSFGSIRMSDFGSELEIRRQSDRKRKLTELESQDDYEYGGSNNVDMIQLGGETENLRNLQRSPSVFSDNVEETLHVPNMADDSFQLNPRSEAEYVKNEDALAHQRISSIGGPVLADSVLEIDDAGGADDDDEDASEANPPSGGQSRRQTLLESVAAAARSRPRKKLKMNRKGNMVPCLPSSLIKRIVNESQESAGKRKIMLGKDHMKALEQAAEWFFEQVGEDLEAYSGHGKRRKRIGTSDVLLLMRRQKVLRGSGELGEMARGWLPPDMLDRLDFSEDR